MDGRIPRPVFNLDIVFFDWHKNPMNVRTKIRVICLMPYGTKSFHFDLLTMSRTSHKKSPALQPGLVTIKVSWLQSNLGTYR